MLRNRGKRGPNKKEGDRREKGGKREKKEGIWKKREHERDWKEIEKRNVGNKRRFNNSNINVNNDIKFAEKYEEFTKLYKCSTKVPYFF